MTNGPELWDRILSHFPEGAIIAGGAVRDYLLGVEPKDIDVFQPYRDYRKDIDGLTAIDYDVNLEQHVEEYNASPHVAIVRHGILEGATVDYIGVHQTTTEAIVNAFDTGLSQVWYDGELHSTPAFDKDAADNTVTVLNDDRPDRLQKRFERFNTRMGGKYTLVSLDGKEYRQALRESIREHTDDFVPL